MERNRLLSFVTSMVLLITAMPTNVSLAAKDEQRLKRTVYLHARDVEYSGKEDTTTVYTGDITNVYFAVDNPNMGDYIGEDDERNATIQSEIDKAVKGVVEKYEKEVTDESVAAIDYAAERLTEYFNETNKAEKDKLKTKIEKSVYFGYLTKSIDEITPNDFNKEGKLLTID